MRSNIYISYNISTPKSSLVVEEGLVYFQLDLSVSEFSMGKNYRKTFDLNIFKEVE